MEIVIAEAVRSAVGRGFKGTLSTKRPDELAADVDLAAVAQRLQVLLASPHDVSPMVVWFI